MTPRGAGLVIAALVVLTMGGVTVSACVGDDPDPVGAVTPDAATSPAPTGSSPVSEGGGGAANGAACGKGDECASTHCVDGVCCESACAGVCERCNAPSQPGTCAAINAGEDPDRECLPKPYVIVDPADGGSSDAGPQPPPLVLADGGEPPPVVATECVGRCDGKRACDYPGSKRECGTTFCPASTTAANARCDGAGHCGYETTSCGDFTCSETSDGCRATCTGPADCAPTSVCDNGKCKAKLALGSVCQSPAQCVSGYCANGVCCNSPCNTGALTCSAQGQCLCTECTSGPCALWYRDRDADGYGDKFGDLSNGGAKYACAADVADGSQTGYSRNNLDCYDHDTDPAAKLVRPDQTGFMATGYKIDFTGPTRWDYNCDGKDERQYPLEPRKTCRKCTSACEPDDATTRCTLQVATGHDCAIVVANDKKTCQPINQAAYRSATGCGVTGTLFVCGACDGDGIDVTEKSAVQGCR